MLGVNKRDKMNSVAKRIWQIHSKELKTQPNWPGIKGYYVLINEYVPNLVGAKKKDAPVKRDKKQVMVLCTDDDAKKKFEETFELGQDDEASPVLNGDAEYDKIQYYLKPIAFMNELTNYKRIDTRTPQRRQGKLPTRIREVLNKNNRTKIIRLGGAVWDLHNGALQVGNDDPELHGYYVLINDINPNKQGYEDIKRKRRDETQVTILCPNDRAKLEFCGAFRMNRFGNSPDTIFSYVPDKECFKAVFTEEDGDDREDQSADGEDEDEDDDEIEDDEEEDEEEEYEEEDEDEDEGDEDEGDLDD